MILHHNSAKPWNWDTHRDTDTHWITDTNQKLGHALELRTRTDISSQTQMAEKNEKNDNFVPLESKVFVKIGFYLHCSISRTESYFLLWMS